MDELQPGRSTQDEPLRCENCGEIVTLEPGQRTGVCGACGAPALAPLAPTTGGPAVSEEDRVLPSWLHDPAAILGEPGEYLCFEDGGEIVVVPLTREWTRIGRSLAADVRFDDPTVSRRHALIVRQADGVRLLDDRSLNGVFVNGERVDGRTLADGDEIIIGRYRLCFVSVAHEAEARESAGSAHGSLHPIG